MKASKWLSLTPDSHWNGMWGFPEIGIPKNWMVCSGKSQVPIYKWMILTGVPPFRGNAQGRGFVATASASTPPSARAPRLGSGRCRQNSWSRCKKRSGLEKIQSCCQIEVSWVIGVPPLKSSILVGLGFSLTKTIQFLGYPHLWKPPNCFRIYMIHGKLM